MIDVPRLDTERLVLRVQTMDDWPDYLAMMQSARSRGLGGPFETAFAWGIFCHDLAQWPLLGHGALMMEERTTGRCIGQVGINHGPLFPEHELGWFVYPQAEGKGFAREAASALRDWGLGPRGLDTLVSYVDPDNLRSRRVAERLGAVLDPDAPRKDPSDLVYRHSR
jgi:RimJ/RimL family protein N-acetyltransferase